MDSRKHEADEEEQTFLPKAINSDHAELGDHRPRTRGAAWYLRLILEIAMAATIVYLIVAKPLIASRPTLRRTPVPQC